MREQLQPPSGMRRQRASDAEEACAALQSETRPRGRNEVRRESAVVTRGGGMAEGDVGEIVLHNNEVSRVQTRIEMKDVLM